MSFFRMPRAVGLALTLTLSLAFLAGCSSTAQRAPVEDRTVAATFGKTPVAEPEGDFYVVKKGDTLSHIAGANKVSVKDLMAWNDLPDPNKVEVDRRLRIVPPMGANGTRAEPVAQTAPVESRPLPPASGQTANQAAGKPATAVSGTNTPNFKHEPLTGKQAYSEQAWAKARASDGTAQADKPEAAPKPEAKPEAKLETKPETKPTTKPSAPTKEWAWPAPGKVIQGYDGKKAKGVNIAGKPGDAVLAAGTGKVVYAGTDLRGYGKVVIVKHNPQFISVYGDNGNILVKEGQAVTQGQKLAEMGKAEDGSGRLHFEVRQLGKPVDPMKFLPAR